MLDEIEAAFECLSVFYLFNICSCSASIAEPFWHW